jgi:hypothetical protein
LDTLFGDKRSKPAAGDEDCKPTAVDDGAKEGSANESKPAVDGDSQQAASGGDGKPAAYEEDGNASRAEDNPSTDNDVAMKESVDESKPAADDGKPNADDAEKESADESETAANDGDAMAEDEPRSTSVDEEDGNASKAEAKSSGNDDATSEEPVEDVAKKVVGDRYQPIKQQLEAVMRKWNVGIASNGDVMDVDQLDGEIQVRLRELSKKKDERPTPPADAAEPDASKDDAEAKEGQDADKKAPPAESRRSDPAISVVTNESMVVEESAVAAAEVPEEGAKSANPASQTNAGGDNG